MRRKVISFCVFTADVRKIEYKMIFRRFRADAGPTNRIEIYAYLACVYQITNTSCTYYYVRLLKFYCMVHNIGITIDFWARHGEDPVGISDINHLAAVVTTLSLFTSWQDGGQTQYHRVKINLTFLIPWSIILYFPAERFGIYSSIFVISVSNQN